MAVLLLPTSGQHICNCLKPMAFRTIVDLPASFLVGLQVKDHFSRFDASYDRKWVLMRHMHA